MCCDPSVNLTSIVLFPDGPTDLLFYFLSPTADYRSRCIKTHQWMLYPPPTPTHPNPNPHHPIESNNLVFSTVENRGPIFQLNLLYLEENICRVTSFLHHPPLEKIMGKWWLRESNAKSIAIFLAFQLWKKSHFPHSKNQNKWWVLKIELCWSLSLSETWTE